MQNERGLELPSKQGKTRWNSFTSKGINAINALSFIHSRTMHTDSDNNIKTIHHALANHKHTLPTLN